MGLYIKKYIEWKATYATRAAVNYRVPLKRFDEFIKKDLEEIGLGDIVKFQNMIQDRFSPVSAAFAIVVLKDFLKFWYCQGYKVVSPTLIRIPRFEPRSHVAISPDEFKKIDTMLGESEFYELERKVIIRLLWETGARISELCDLNVSDVDAQRKKALITTKKNKQPRWIMWSETTHRLLLKYLGVRICLNQQPALFLASEKGGRRERISTRTTQRWIKEIVHRAGIIKKISAHSFRHGKAHEVLRRGGNVKHIQSILGHSERNPVASFTYLKLNETEFDNMAGRFLD